MPRRFASAAVRILTLSVLTLLAIHATAQAPVLDVTYTPDPASSTIGGARAARPRLLNARGSSNPLAPVFLGPPATPPELPGSQSYNYIVPVLSLPGRAGMDLNLNLYYNSRVWDVDTTANTITFNADRDFPSYGFRLDFGFLEYDPANDQYIYTERDGSKHDLPNSGNYDSNDGTYMRYTVAQQVLAYRNGTKVHFEVFPSQSAATPPTLFRPVWVEDTNGNYISITYLAGHDQLISTITDTLGRVIHFNYDGTTHQLSTITQNVQVSTADPSGVRTYATFTWGTVALNYHFTLTAQNSPPTGTSVAVITRCVYPNGAGYQFSYGDWGIVNRIDNFSPDYSHL